MNRTRLRIVGQSGSGLLTVGDIFCKALQSLGFYLCADREYPSLIKGGHAAFTINFSEKPIHSLSREVDILVAIDKHSLVAYHDVLQKGGVLVHGYERLQGIADILQKLEKRGVRVVSVPSRALAEQHGGTFQMANIILLGLAWRVLGFELRGIQNLIEQKFVKKPVVLAIAKKCLQAAFDSVADTAPCLLQLPQKKEKTLLLDGNHALALGAIHAGMRFYVAYPMSPSSSILQHVALLARDTGIIVKQAEDEITAAQMALGAMFAGTRALTATSGGGFDLMTETLSVSGILENPLVIVLGQRPGPGTGLPTWTAQADLELAIHSGHGEFPRVVLSCSDPSDCFEVAQQAFNFAEKFQVPVIILTEKVVCESDMTVAPFSLKKIKIERGLVAHGELKELKSSDRYRMTESGVSPRWLPGGGGPHFFANGDEHWTSGELTEDAEFVEKMYAKRMRKTETILAEIPEPEILGEEKNAQISFVSWGSTRTVLLDAIEVLALQGVRANAIHFRFVWPIRTEPLNTFFVQNKNVHLIEGNYTGQFGRKVEHATGRKFAGKFLKYNGRPFFLEDVLEYINDKLKITNYELTQDSNSVKQKRERNLDSYPQGYES